LYQCWNKLIELLKINSNAAIRSFSVEYNEAIREKWGESIFKNQVKTKDITMTQQGGGEAGKEH
jgi:hypothetical protein